MRVGRAIVESLLGGSHIVHHCSTGHGHGGQEPKVFGARKPERLPSWMGGKYLLHRLQILSEVSI